MNSYEVTIKLQESYELLKIRQTYFGKAKGKAKENLFLKLPWSFKAFWWNFEVFMKLQTIFKLLQSLQSIVEIFHNLSLICKSHEISHDCELKKIVSKRIAENKRNSISKLRLDMIPDSS